MKTQYRALDNAGAFCLVHKAPLSGYDLFRFSSKDYQSCNIMVFDLSEEKSESIVFKKGKSYPEGGK